MTQPMLDLDDAYENPSAPVPVGEHALTFEEDGTVTGRRKPPDERPNTWKDAKKIESCPDSAITQYATRRSGIIDYRLLGVSVSWRGLGHGKRRQYLCHTHVTNSCPHTKRIDRYRKERA